MRWPSVLNLSWDVLDEFKHSRALPITAGAGTATDLALGGIDSLFERSVPTSMLSVLLVGIADERRVGD